MWKLKKGWSDTLLLSKLLYVCGLSPALSVDLATKSSIDTGSTLLRYLLSAGVNDTVGDPYAFTL